LFLENLKAARDLEEARRLEDSRRSEIRITGKSRPPGPALPRVAIDDDEDKLEKKDLSPDEFVTAEQIERELSSFHLVEFGPSAGSHAAGSTPIATPFIIEFHTRPQPSFNRQFDLLMRDL